jgi:hypothetical protein
MGFALSIKTSFVSGQRTLYREGGDEAKKVKMK